MKASFWNIAVSTFVAGVVIVATPVRADSVPFNISGNGITASGVLTVSPASVPGVPGAVQITGVTGFFSDTNASANFSGAITGLQTTSLPSNFNPDGTFIPPGAPSATLPFSYDNLFYPGGNSPLVCEGYPFSGGKFDIYGLLLNVAGGYTVDLWSNGIYAPGTPADYELSDALGSTLLEPDNEGVAIPVSVTTTPEPGTLMLLGTGMLGLAGALTRRKNASRFTA